MSENDNKSTGKKKGFIGRIVEKLDKKIEQKAKSSCCCSGGKGKDKGSSCC